MKRILLFAVVTFAISAFAPRSASAFTLLENAIEALGFVEIAIPKNQAQQEILFSKIDPIKGSNGPGAVALSANQTGGSKLSAAADLLNNCINNGVCDRDALVSTLHQAQGQNMAAGGAVRGAKLDLTSYQDYTTANVGENDAIEASLAEIAIPF